MTDTLEVAVRGARTFPEHARERLFTGGPSALEAAELVAILLAAPEPLGASAATTEPETAARFLLDRVGGLRSLASSTPGDLAAVPGVGDARAARIVASIELGRRLHCEPLPRGAYFRDGADIFRHYHAAMRDLRVEQFRIVLLDGKHRFLREELISQGTLTSSPVHPREVFAPAIRHSAAAVVLVHNHPSGDPTPSADDLDITTRLADVGRLVGIRVVDHVIVGDGAFVSLGDRGLVPR